MKTLKKSGILLPLSVVILMLTSCGGGKDKQAQLDKMKSEYASLGEKIKVLESELAIGDSSSTKTKDVYVTTVQTESFKHFIDVQGHVDARENVDVSAKTGGVVKRILVKEGQSVTAGQVLAELESDIYQTQIAALNTQLSFATDIYNRQKRLWDQKVGSEVQYLQAKANKEGLEKQLATLQENLDMTKIKSLITGTVDAVNLKVGQLAAPGVPAFKVVNYSDLRVVANISEVYTSKVQVGNTVQLQFPDISKSVNGKVQFVSKVIDPMKRTFNAEVSLDGDKSAYRPNMIVVMKIVDYENEGAIVLPINVIQSMDNQSFVYVAAEKGGKTSAIKTPVTLGVSYDGRVEISSGIKAGDAVVTSGQFDLTDGISVNIREK